MKKTVFYVGPVGWGKKSTPYNSHEEACRALVEKERRSGIYDHRIDIIKVEIDENGEKKVVR